MCGALEYVKVEGRRKRIMTRATKLDFETLTLLLVVYCLIGMMDV